MCNVICVTLAGTSYEDSKSTETDRCHQGRSGKQGLQNGAGSLNQLLLSLRCHSDLTAVAMVT